MIITVSAQNFFDKKPTGVDFYTKEIIKNLSKVCADEDKIIVYIKKSPVNQESESLADAPWRNVFFKELKFKRFFNLLGVFWATRKEKPDVIFCPSSVAPFSGNKNIIVTIHGLEFKTYPRAYSFFDRLWMDFSTRLSIFLSRKIIVPSLATKNDLIKYYGVNSEKIFIIRHGYTLNLEMSEFFGVKKNKRQILFLGRVEKRKNIEILIEAFEKIYDKFPDTSLILAGKNGFKAEEILVRIKKSPAQERIILKGYVDESEKKNLLISSGVLVFPSGAEGFGFPVLEGQASRCAIICSDIEALKETAGQGALFFKQGDANDLVKNLSNVIMDDKMVDDLIYKGLKNLERFSWQKSAQETYNLIKL